MNSLYNAVNRIKMVVQKNGEEWAELHEDVNLVANHCKMLAKVEDLQRKFVESRDESDFLVFYFEKTMEICDTKHAALLAVADGAVRCQIGGTFRLEDKPLNATKSIARTISNVFKTQQRQCAFKDTCRCPESCNHLRDLNLLCVPLSEQNGLQYQLLVEGQRPFKKDQCDLLTTFVQRTENYVLDSIKYSDQTSGQCRADGLNAIIGKSAHIKETIHLIRRIADSRAPVLIQGESGTGKELIALAIHNNSSRSHKRFVPVNCGAIPETMIESELFGHVRGAFTDAVREKPGWFEKAGGSTIFLDEIETLPLSSQVRLLRVLQTGEYSPLGSGEIRRSDVRTVAACNQVVQDLVKAGSFRQDLYYRLNVITVNLSPLRERRVDIPLLTRHFIEYFRRMYGKGNIEIRPEAEKVLMAYDFPGNVRELENIIHRAVVLLAGNTIETCHFPPGVLLNSNSNDTIAASLSGLVGETSTFKQTKKRVLERFERQYIEECLAFSHGNITRAARHAGIFYKNFYEKMKKYRIEPDKHKKSIV